MPPNTPVFLLGLAVGAVLLVFGLLLGFWLGKRTGHSADVVNRKQFLLFLKNLSTWTSEFAGDVSKYQSQLSTLSNQVGVNGDLPRAEIQQLLTQIMKANQQLQNRLDSTEQKLESQTNQIASYLTEARTDGLTGLPNRRSFDSTLNELFASWQAKGQSFTLGLIDIDHFKKVNDTYGHPAGDAVLKKVAETLQLDLADSVCVARYGGEEFAVLTVAPLEEAVEHLENLRSTMSKIEIEHDGKIISVTLSSGAAQILPDEKIGKLVRRSDEALYAAKLGGRNRVFLHDGTVCRQVTKNSSLSSIMPAPASTSQSLADEGVDELQQRIQERLERIVEEETRRQAAVSQPRA